MQWYLWLYPTARKELDTLLMKLKKNIDDDEGGEK